MENRFFKDPNLQTQLVSKGLKREKIMSMIPEDFNGKEDFIQFYMAYNGIYFINDAKASSEEFTEEGEYYYIRQIERFYTSKGIQSFRNGLKEQAEEVRKFVETHIPFAGDAAGNDFFIEIPSGEIKFVSWEFGLEEGLVWIAPSFKDFCLAIFVEEDDIED